MADTRLEQRRNLALVGHAACGKTSLAEALLVAAGVLNEPGSIERGTTVSDFDPLEQRHHHSLNTTILGFSHAGVRVNILDTPGDPDLIGRSLSALPAVECAVLVVSATAGIEPVTRRVMEQLRAHGMAAMIVISKIDAAGEGELAARIAELREAFGPEVLPVNLPAGGASRVVDCFDHAAGQADFSSVAEAHQALMEQVVEVDDALTERYLEEGDVDPATLHDPFEQALREGHLIPVCFTSTRSSAGIAELLDVVERLAPNPLEGTPHFFIAGHGDKAKRLLARPNADRPVLAHVFKIDYDPFLGKLGTLRVHQGVISRGDTLLIDDGNHSFKVGHLFRMHGKEHLEIPRAGPGAICAVAKVDDLHLDAILHGTHEFDDLHAEPWDLPAPVVRLALTPESHGDEQKVSDVLHRIVAEDPCLSIEHDISANETVLRGLGEYHLRVALEKMDDRYHVRVATRPPSVPYRETITRSASGHHRHKKQTGGAGQFGEVMLEVEPLERGAGFEFVDRVTGGAIPASLILAVEKGVRQVIEGGAIAGFPVVDVRVTVTDGKTHSVDSKEVAFVTAGRKAFIDAVGNAGAIVLEPIAALQVRAPAASIGDISGDLASRRARILGTDASDDGTLTITAEAPLAELDDYATRLRSLTAGAGAYAMQFARYEPAPPKVQQSLTAAHRPRQDD